MNIDPNNALVWVQVGGQMVQVAMGAWASIRGVLAAAGTPEEVLAEVDERHADYVQRIAAAQRRGQ